MSEPKKEGTDSVWPPPPSPADAESGSAPQSSSIVGDFMRGLTIGFVGWVALSRLHWFLSLIFWNVHTPGPPFGYERRVLHAYFIRGETLMSLGLLLATAVFARHKSLPLSRGIYCGIALGVTVFMLPAIFVPGRWMYKGL